MTTADDEPRIVQNVTATVGYAYGAIGADIHVLGSGTPLYVLANHQAVPTPESTWLTEMPSRMLNARFAVVDFTGRTDELVDLHAWRTDGGPRLAVRWLHGPGGQGKTRLADQFAAAAAADGWKVVTAVQGPGTGEPSPGSQDLSPSGSAGVLLLVDYADRWPTSHLKSLFSNALLHQAVPTRILMLARPGTFPPAIAKTLNDLQAGISHQPLGPLPTGPGDRTRMFTAARNSFATHYTADGSALGPSVPLDHPDLGLTLAVHMAALVAVDAHVHGHRPPSDVAGLTRYLLDREHDHWDHLYTNRTHDNQTTGLDYQTPPSVMAQAVFTAVLTGPVDHPTGKAILTSLDLETRPGRVLIDHARCYPPTEPDRVLEPLYPDRLAEDFLALTIPGHPADYPAQPWASAAATRLLTDGHGDDNVRAALLSRAVTSLAAATDRWPHVGDTCLYPLLHSDPSLAVTAGSAALSALATIEGVDLRLLGKILILLPPRRHVDLDVGTAEITARLTPHLLAATEDLAQQATLHAVCSGRLYNAGRYEEALASMQAALAIRRQLAESEPGTRLDELAASLINLGVTLPALGRYDEALEAIDEAVAIIRGGAGADPADLAIALTNRGSCMSGVGRLDEAVASTKEAIDIFRRLAEVDGRQHLPQLAPSLSNLGDQLSANGLHEDALPLLEEAVAVRRHLAETDATTYLPDLTMSLNALANCLRKLGRRDEGLALAEEIVAIRRRLVTVNPTAFQDLLAGALNNLGLHLNDLRRYEAAIPPVEEATVIYRRLASANPNVHLPDLAMSLNTLSNCLVELGHFEQALASIEEVLTVRRTLAGNNAGAHLPDLAGALSNYGARLSKLGRLEEAMSPTRESVGIYRRLATANPSAYLPSFATSLHNLGSYLLQLGRHADALPSADEAVVVRRQLAAVTPAVHLPDLIGSLNNQGVCLSELGCHTEAVAAAQEAADAGRRLAEEDPARYSADLAATLTNLGAFMARQGRLNDALPAVLEAVNLCREAATRAPRAQLEIVAASLLNLGVRLAEAGRYDDALTTAEEAVAIRRALAENSDVTALPKLAASLFQLGAILWNLGRHEQALPSAAEAVALYRRLADTDPPAYLPELAASLGNHSNNLAGVGRHQQALPPAQEAADLYRRLAVADPLTHSPSLAMSLHNLGARLFDLERYDEALTTAEEAVAVRRTVARTSPPDYGAKLAMSLVGYASVCVRVQRNLPNALSAVQEAISHYKSLVGRIPDVVGPHLLSAFETLIDVLAALGRVDEARSLRQTLDQLTASADPEST